MEHALGEAFDIANEAQPEADSPKFVVAGHVAPRVEQGAYKITFSELGRPPEYSGNTSLTIRPQERRVLMLPAIDLASTILGTVVLIRYKTTDEDDGFTVIDSILQDELLAEAGVRNERLLQHPALIERLLPFDPARPGLTGPPAPRRFVRRSCGV